MDGGRHGGRFEACLGAATKIDARKSGARTDVRGIDGSQHDTTVNAQVVKEARR